MLQKLINKIEDRLIAKFIKSFKETNNQNDSLAQKQLSLYYRQLLISGQKLPELSEVGWKNFSQTDEDGILHYIFSIIGKQNKKCVEICAGDAKECNTTNLLVNDNWYGLLIDGNNSNVEKGKKWFKTHPSTYVYPPLFICEWVTQENINEIISKHNFTGDIDLLSIDVDGVDFWLWKALSIISPRVVVIEYQQHLGPDKSLTVPYSSDFKAWRYPVTNGWLPNYAGASLKALTKLGKEKGYRLVGCNTYCFNAFFVRSDISEDLIPTVTVESCFSHPRAKWSIKERFPTVAGLEWIEV